MPRDFSGDAADKNCLINSGKRACSPRGARFRQFPAKKFPVECCVVPIAIVQLVLDMFGRSRSMGTPKAHRSQALEAMQRNKRMARTLGCLVASMTLGAALLDWVQPKRAPVAVTSGTELMGILPRGTAPVLWRGIQLDPQESGSVKSHFLIDQQGRWSPTALWREQTQIGDEGVVRIGLLAVENSNQVTAEQVGMAYRLIRALQRECDIPGERIHHDMLAVPEVPEPAPTRNAVTPPRSGRK